MDGHEPRAAAHYDRPSRIPWPPLLLGLALMAAAGLERTAPSWPMFSGAPLNGALWQIVGWACIVAALAIDVWCLWTFRRHRTTVLPHGTASALITTGPFAHSRNPIYAAHTLLLVGVGLLWPSAWLLALVPLKVILVRQLAILPEEAHLQARFGHAWEAYAARVRRWV
ncbi:MAG: isoprenylcysteine carboxylmethyltransferase family protein [Pseudomonadota bacterium]